MIRMDYGPAASRFSQNMRAFAATVELLGDNVVRQTMEKAGGIMDATAPVDTGRLRASRTAAHSPKRLTWQTGYTVPYAPVLEYGGYRGVGPKTIALGGGTLGAGFTAGAGIYAKQSPLGWVRKALAQVEKPYYVRIQTMVRQAWHGQMATGGSQEALPTLGSGGLSELFGVDIED